MDLNSIITISVVWAELDYSVSKTDSYYDENTKHFVFEKYEKGFSGLKIYKIMISKTSDGYIVDKTVQKGHGEKAIAECINENELEAIQETIKELKKYE